jgi:hypothetical protein
MHSMWDRDEDARTCAQSSGGSTRRHRHQPRPPADPRPQSGELPGAPGGGGRDGRSRPGQATKTRPECWDRHAGPHEPGREVSAAQRQPFKRQRGRRRRESNPCTGLCRPQGVTEILARIIAACAGERENRNATEPPAQAPEGPVHQRVRQERFFTGPRTAAALCRARANPGRAAGGNL